MVKKLKIPKKKGKIDFKQVEMDRRLNRKATVKLDQEIRIYQKHIMEFNNALEDFLEEWEAKEK